MTVSGRRAGSPPLPMRPNLDAAHWPQLATKVHLSAGFLFLWLLVSSSVEASAPEIHLPLSRHATRRSNEKRPHDGQSPPVLFQQQESEISQAKNDPYYYHHNSPNVSLAFSNPIPSTLAKFQIPPGSKPPSGFNTNTVGNNTDPEGQFPAQMRRHRRHVVASPGSIQLQETRRKAAAAGNQNLPGGANKASGGQANNKRQVIYAMLKGQVVIPCNLQPPEQDDAVSLVLWYKDKSMVPIYSVDARSAPIQEARHKPGPWLEGRATLKIFGQDVSPQPTTKTKASRRRRKRRSAPLLPPSSYNRLRRRHHLCNGDVEAEQTEPEASQQRPLIMEPDEAEAEDEAAGLDDEDYDGAATTDERRPMRLTAAKWMMSAPVSTAPRGARRRNWAAKRQASEWRRPEASNMGWHRLVEMGQSGPPSGPMSLTAPQQQLVAHLYVDSLSSEDNGLYSCRVDFRKARSRTQETLLRIIVPADKPIVRDLTAGDSAGLAMSAGQQIAASMQQTIDSPQIAMARPPATIGNDPTVQIVGPHNEGARLVLQCETQGGYPDPALTWWRNGRLLDDSYELVSGADGLVVSRHAGWTQSGGGQADAGGDPDELQLLTADMFRSRAKLVGEPNELMIDPSAGWQQQDGTQLEESLAQTVAGAANGPNGDGAGSAIELASAAASDDPQASSSSDQFEPGAGGNPAGSSPREQLASLANGAKQNRLIRNRLELRALTRNDLLANYSCQAWNTKLSEPPATSVMIDMNLRPIKVQIDNERLPVLADQPLEIVCRAFGSRPTALITWWRGNTRLVPSNDINSPTSGQHQHGHHHHQQQHQELRGDPSGRLLQPQQLAPNSVQIQESVSADSNVTSSSMTMVPRLEDGGQIISCRAENPYMQQMAGNSIEDSWKLEVHYLPRVRLALGEKLHHQGLIHEGHDVYFECSVEALPAAREIRWWFDGRELETNISSGVIISNQSLVLQRVNRHQRGRYTCSAMNSVGESHSNSVHLRVQYAPFCRDHSSADSAATSTRQHPAGDSTVRASDTAAAESEGGPFAAISQQRFKTHYGASRMESVKVYCHIDADPVESISYKWAFVATQTNNGSQSSTTQWPAKASANPGPQFSGQQLVYLDPGSISSPYSGALVSVATYTPRSELDYGTLLCWGSNSLGQQAEPCAYQIVPAERPDSLRNCRLVNASDIQLTVACEPGYDGGVDQSFQMEVYDAGKHELVANISSISFDGLGLASGNLLGAGASRDEQPFGEDPAGDSASGDGGNGHANSNNGPASLVSGEQLFGTRQQKQRHSAGQHGAAAASNQEQQQQQQQAATASGRHIPLETLFVTEPILRPATHYFLSIYSTNSKGSSKPVAFTASTMNLTSAEIGSSSLASATLRDGRRSADPSHLLSDVLALSWSPSLLICAITVLLFIMFASITFAMMKYVDFSAAFPLSSAQTVTTNGSTSSPSGYGPCLPTKEPRGRGYANGHEANSTRNGAGNGGNNRFELGNNNNNNSNNSTDNETTDDRGGDGSNKVTLAGQRARVITIASAANNGAHNDHSSGIQHHQGVGSDLLVRGQAGESFLNGPFLKFRIQQLIGQQDGGTGRLKQSNSDNFLDQLGNQTQGQQMGPRQSAAMMPQLATNSHLCGTLPKNGPAATLKSLAITRQSANSSTFQNRLSKSFSSHQQKQQGHNQVQMRDLESPYGLARAGFVTPNTAGTYSGSAGNGGVQHALTSLVLTAPSVGGRPAFPGPTSGQQQPLPLQPPPPPLGDRRAEQLVISGEQYIHQTQTGLQTANWPPFQHHQQRQSPTNSLGQRAEQRHLQLTSNCASHYGSLQRNNLYGFTSTSAKGPAAGCGNAGQQLGGQVEPGESLVCTSHQEQQQQQMWHQHQQLSAVSQVINELSANVGMMANNLESQSAVVDVGGYGTTSALPSTNMETSATGQVQQQQSSSSSSDDRLTSENYPAIGSDRNSVTNNNVTTLAHRIAAIKDDLVTSDEQVECSVENGNMLNQANDMCHHLTLIQGPLGTTNLAAFEAAGGYNNMGIGAGNGNLDSDGLSSGTQRSLTTNTLTTTTGSPSSGIVEMDGAHNHYNNNGNIHQQSASSHRHNHPHGNNSGNIYLKTQQIVSTSSSSTTIASSSDRGGTNSSANAEQDSVLGNVISVGQSYSNGIPDARCMMAQASLRRPRITSGASAIRQAKKNQFNNNHQTINYGAELLGEFDPGILDQCTMFVDGNEFQLTDVNNNQLIGQHHQQFYALPADEYDKYSTTKQPRVRLVGINGADLSNRPLLNSNQLPSLNQTGPATEHQQLMGIFNHRTSVSNIMSHNSSGFHGQVNGNQSDGNDLHTDV